MKRWSTVQDFIVSGKAPASETVAAFEGFASKGDGGASFWVKTGSTGVPSQSPTDLNAAVLTDSQGVYWRPTSGAIFYFDGANQWFPAPFGNDGAGLYQFDGVGWNYYEQAGGAVSIAVTTGLITNAFNYDVGTALTFSGYSNPGDGGGAQWIKTNTLDTPSQTPAIRGDGALTDALGYVWRLVSNKTNAKSFGLTGSGDETSVLQAIANWLNPDREVEFTDNFAITATVTFSNGGTLTLNDTIIDGTGLPSNTADRTLNQALVFTGSLESSVSIGADITAGNDTFTAVGAGLSVGDTVIVRSDQAFVDGWAGSVNNRRGEILTISEVSGDLYTVSEGFKFSYLSASNLRVEKINPTSPKIKGGLLQMGGVGSEHRGVQLIYARNAEIDGLIVKGGEDYNVSIEYSHSVKYRGECWDATTPSGGFNTGYGVASINGSRNIDIDITGYNCKHVVTSGGFLPSLETRVRGVAYDSGLTTTAFDCHEPCFGWDWDIECYGGNAGIGIRGSEQKCKIKARGLASNAVRVKAFDNPGLQYDVDISIDSDGTGATSVLIDTDSCPIEGVAIDGRIKNSTLNGVAVVGDVTNGVTNVKLNVDIDTTSTEAVDIRFTTGVTGDVRARNSGAEAIQAFDSANISIDVDADVNTDNAIYLLRVDNSTVGGNYARSGNTAAIFTEDCNNINIAIDNVEAVGGSSDCWRAVDTIGGKLIGSTLTAGRHGIFSSGTSDKFIASLNDASGVTNADKFNLSGAGNVEINNIV